MEMEKLKKRNKALEAEVEKLQKENAGDRRERVLEAAQSKQGLGEARSTNLQVLRRQCQTVVDAIELQEDNALLASTSDKMVDAHAATTEAKNAAGKTNECKYNGQLGWLSNDTSGQWTKGSWSKCRPEGFNGKTKTAARYQAPHPSCGKDLSSLCKREECSVTDAPH